MDHIPVVKLTEKSLRRLKEKIEKLHLDKTTKDEDTQNSLPKISKFEVYRPGVSRLSNRSSSDRSNAFSTAISDNSGGSEKITTNNSDTKVLESTKNPRHRSATSTTRNNLKSSKYRVQNESHQRESRFKSSKGRTVMNNKYKSDHITSRTFTKRDARSSSESSYDEEEGFLARHERRRRRQGYESNSSNGNSDREVKKPHTSDDEFIWDDYHGDFLNDEFSISTTSDDFGLTNSTTENRVKQHYVRSNDEDAENLPDFQVKFQQTAKKNDLPMSRDDSSPATRKRADEAKPHDRGLVKISENFVHETPNDSKKSLFNPDNPDIPIMVRPNLRDKKIKSKLVKSDSESCLVSSPGAPASENNYSSGDRYDVSRYKPSPIPSKYTSHPNHWNAPVGIDFVEFEHDRNADSHDILSSVISDRDSESHDTLLKKAESIELTINNLISPRQFSLKSFNEKLQISRTELKQIYKTLILQHIEVASKQNIEQMLWKTVYHQPLEQLRKQISSSSGDEKNDLKNLLIVILDQATDFYENLLMRLQQMYKINLKELFANVSAYKQLLKRIGKRTKLAIMSCQRSLICLGDISRYKENANETSNFGRARQYYIQARSIEPRNGRPYNQLALLAVHTRRKLDAIYYYARSLATVGTPILTARESLIALFDDARRKYLKTTSASHKVKTSLVEAELQNNENTLSKKRSGISPRMMWIHPDQDEVEQVSEVKHDLTDREDKPSRDQLSPAEMKPTQLLRHFILVFTHLHGKFFTRVGLDTFDCLKKELLDLFSLILSSDKVIINEQTLLHVFAVNIFSVFDQKQRQDKNDSTGSSWLLLQSVQLTFSMVAILTRHVSALLRQIPTNQLQVYDPLLSGQLLIFLSSLKLSCDWMYSNKSLWYPDTLPRPSNISHDLWASLAELCDWLIGDFKKFPMRIYSHNAYNLEEVCLHEDSEFSGFAPLSNFECEARYVLISEYTNTEQRSRASACVRLDLVRDFLEYLCGMEQPMLAFKQGRYVVLFENPVTEEEIKPRLSSTDEVLSDLIKNDDQPSDDNYDDDVIKSDDQDFTELRALRDSLQKTKHHHDKRKDQIIASLEEGSDGGNIRVTPRDLIPDTNCFIDHLDHIQLLITSGNYVVFVPLVVIVELQGLAQDSKGNDDHAVKVFKNASAAVDFLKRKFSTERDSKIQALTNQGSILHTISFQSQSDVNTKATNDDLILQCCVKHEEKSKSEGVVRTVLLSDDRNLRVKALARNMPTKSLPDFCKWANIIKT